MVGDKSGKYSPAEVGRQLLRRAPAGDRLERRDEQATAEPTRIGQLATSGWLNGEDVARIRETPSRRRERQRLVVRTNQAQMSRRELIVEGRLAGRRRPHRNAALLGVRCGRVGERRGHVGLLGVSDQRFGFGGPGARSTCPGWMTDGSVPITDRLAAYQRGHSAAISGSEESDPRRCAAMSHSESPGRTRS
jgi:hypothetical protein